MTLLYKSDIVKNSNYFIKFSYLSATRWIYPSPLCIFDSVFLKSKSIKIFFQKMIFFLLKVFDIFHNHGLWNWLS